MECQTALNWIRKVYGLLIRKDTSLNFFRELLQIGKVTLFFSTCFKSFSKKVNQSDLIVVLDHLDVEAKLCPECGDNQTVLGKGSSNGFIRDTTLTWG